MLIKKPSDLRSFEITPEVFLYCVAHQVGFLVSLQLGFNSEPRLISRRVTDVLHAVPHDHIKCEPSAHKWAVPEDLNPLDNRPKALCE